jgi:hypothetical protein
VRGEVKIKPRSTGKSIPEVIISAAEEAEAEILVFGTTSSKKLGSVSSYLMRHAPLATMVIKDHVDAGAGSNRGSRLSGAAEDLLASELYRSASLRASRRATADADWSVDESADPLTSMLNRAPSFTKRQSMELDPSMTLTKRPSNDLGSMTFGARSQVSVS